MKVAANCQSFVFTAATKRLRGQDSQTELLCTEGYRRLAP